MAGFTYHMINEEGNEVSIASISEEPFVYSGVTLKVVDNEGEEYSVPMKRGELEELYVMIRHSLDWMQDPTS